LSVAPTCFTKNLTKINLSKIIFTYLLILSSLSQKQSFNLNFCPGAVENSRPGPQNSISLPLNYEAMTNRQLHIIVGTRREAGQKNRILASKDALDFIKRSKK